MNRANQCHISSDLSSTIIVLYTTAPDRPLTYYTRRSIFGGRIAYLAICFNINFSATALPFNHKAIVGTAYQ